MVGSKADVCRGASAGARLALAIALVAVACSAPAPSYHTDVRRIIDGRCAHCHYDGGLGPLALTTYDEVFAAREPIRSAVVSGTMPPWRAVDGCNDYLGDVSLTDEQIDLISRWVDAGAPEGDPADAAPALPAPEDQRLSRVDRNLPMPVEYTPQRNTDDYRCFILDWTETSTTYLTGFGAVPTNPAIVHHMVAFLVPPHRVAFYEALDRADDDPGYTCFGGPGPENDREVGWLGTWGPGGQGYDHPAGTGIKVTPGSKVVLQMHYAAFGESVAPDRTVLDLQLADRVDREAAILPFANPTWVDYGSMDIPAGDAHVRHRFEIDVTTLAPERKPFFIHSAGVHMHLLGKKGQLFVNHADGSRTCLVRIDDWDFNWQYTYRLRAPVLFEPGDELGIECQWDNSEANQPFVGGARRLAQPVNWGQGSSDEMCLGVMYLAE